VPLWIEGTEIRNAGGPAALAARQSARRLRLGSHGGNRSLVLALKLPKLEMYRQLWGEPPLLLLDDGLQLLACCAVRSSNLLLGGPVGKAHSDALEQAPTRTWRPFNSPSWSRSAACASSSDGGKGN